MNLTTNLRSSLVVLTVSSASIICSSKAPIFAVKTSEDSAPKIIDDNPLKENPPDLAGALPLSNASCKKGKAMDQSIFMLTTKNSESIVI